MNKEYIEFQKQVSGKPRRDRRRLYAQFRAWKKAHKFEDIQAKILEGTQDGERRSGQNP